MKRKKKAEREKRGRKEREGYENIFIAGASFDYWVCVLYIHFDFQPLGPRKKNGIFLSFIFLKRGACLAWRKKWHFFKLLSFFFCHFFVE